MSLFNLIINYQRELSMTLRNFRKWVFGSKTERGDGGE